MTIQEQALALHEKHHGKLAVQSKVSVGTKEDLALAYTPGVAEVCKVIHEDTSLAKTYTLKNNTVAIISDGSAVLGLGNIGAEAAIPVMEGKAILFKEFADIDAFPLCLSTQDTQELVHIIKNLAPVFGGINLEDIAAPKCFEIERRLREELSIPVMHDDQHGTAVVVLAGLINALRVIEKDTSNVRIVLSGAGAAGLAVTDLLLAYGFTDIIVCDTKGSIYEGRADLHEEKKLIAARTNKSKKVGSIADVLVGADIFIGVSKGGLINAEMVRSMAEKSIVFALANPTPEIMPDEAKKGGAYIVATGRSDFPNQINNVFAFPGIFRGALDNGVRMITTTMLMNAAQNLAAYVTNPSPENILPSIFDKQVVQVVAQAIRS